MKKLVFALIASALLLSGAPAYAEKTCSLPPGFKTGVRVSIFYIGKNEIGAFNEIDSSGCWIRFEEQIEFAGKFFETSDKSYKWINTQHIVSGWIHHDQKKARPHSEYQRAL
jgi:hypothetical protein